MRHFILAIMIFFSAPLHASFDDYVDVIIDAAEVVGVDPTLLVTIAHQETRFQNVRARAGGSAEGLFQFNDITWRHVLDRFGDEFDIGKDTSKYDVYANSVMGAVYVRENTRRLQTLLGREPTVGEVYMAHLLGPTGARRLLSADTTLIAADVVSYAYVRNQPLFVTSTGKLKTTGQFRDSMNWRMHRLYSDYAGSVEQVLLSRRHPPEPTSIWKTLLGKANVLPDAINRLKEHPLVKDALEHQEAIAYIQQYNRYAG